jgi:hypothetical protein
LGSLRRIYLLPQARTDVLAEKQGCIDRGFTRVRYAPLY